MRLISYSRMKPYLKTLSSLPETISRKQFTTWNLLWPNRFRVLSRAPFLGSCRNLKQGSTLTNMETKRTQMIQYWNSQSWISLLFKESIAKNWRPSRCRFFLRSMLLFLFITNYNSYTWYLFSMENSSNNCINYVLA